MLGAHALLSASGAERWIRCPKSARLEETFPESSSSYADEGTLAHEICQISLNVILHRITKEEYKAKFYECSQSEYYSQEMLDFCEGYVAFVLEELGMEPGNKILVEIRLNLEAYIPKGFGTSDINIIRVIRKRLTVIDFKYGKGVPVSAEQNEQGMVYMLGAFLAYDHIYEIEDCEFIIYQPRLDSISRYVISRDTLLMWAKDVLAPAAALAWDDQGEFNPGDHCRFCRAKQSCRALQEHSLEILKYQFDEAALNNQSLKPGPLLTDAEISEILERSDLFKNWIGAVEKFALEEAVKRGKQWPGFKLVEGISRRRYFNEEQIIFRLEQEGLDDEQIYNKKLRGFEDMTKTLGKLKFKKLLEPYLIKPPGAPTLVSISDPRKPLNSDEKIKDLFDQAGV